MKSLCDRGSFSGFRFLKISGESVGFKYLVDIRKRFPSISVGRSGFGFPDHNIRACLVDTFEQREAYVFDDGAEAWLWVKNSGG